jgi:hypothetical protein
VTGYRLQYIFKFEIPALFYGDSVHSDLIRV